MIDMHYWPTPNGWKISIMLEECGLLYRVVPVRIGRGEQFAPAFLAISPNNRIPAIVDHAPMGSGAPLAIFESGAILQYLAEKSGLLLPTDVAARFRVMSWLMWQMSGLGPMLGQNGHFLLYANEKIPYAMERYRLEARRLYGVLDKQLALTGAHIAGDDYSIADIACFPWVMTHKAQQLTLDDFPHVRRWFAELRARPAVQRGLAVGKELKAAVPAMDEEARSHLFGAAPT
jgi:GST-like protein